MDKGNRNAKIATAIILSFLLATFGIRHLFLSNSPRLNPFFLPELSALVRSFVYLSPTPTPAPPLVVRPTTVPVVPSPVVTMVPLVTNKLVPTLPVPTKVYIPIPTVQIPTKPAPYVCPSSSGNRYASIPTDHSEGTLDAPLSNHPEINLRLRGFTEVKEGTALISRHDNYGLDDKMPPQISSLYGGPVPLIAKTYRIYEWDFDNHKSGRPATATPNFPVHMLGLAATPGQKLLGLRAGREIGGGNVFMVLYATKSDIVFTHSNSDALMGGYLFYFLDICVDPNIIAAYEKDNAGGRSQLPVVAPGQVFGLVGQTDVKVVVRDTMSFMDTRYREDWWDYGK